MISKTGAWVNLVQGKVKSITLWTLQTISDYIKIQKNANKVIGLRFFWESLEHKFLKIKYL